MKKEQVKSIVVKSDGVYVSSMEEPKEKQFSGDQWKEAQANNAFTSSLIKVEEQSFNELLQDKKFPMNEVWNNINFKLDGTYPAPEGLVMEVKMTDPCSNTNCINGGCCKKGTLEVCESRFGKVALCSFLPDKEQEKGIAAHVFPSSVFSPPQEKPEKEYTERELEIAYVTGLLNRTLTMDELSVELKTAQEKIDRLKAAFKRGDFSPNQSKEKQYKTLEGNTPRIKQP